MPIQDIAIGRFAQRHSFIHRLDPRTKMICGLVMTAGLFFFDDVWFLGIFFLLVCTLFAASRLNPTLAFRTVRPFLWLFGLTLILHALFTPGRAWFSIPWFNISVTLEGLERGIFYSLRMLNLLALAGLFTLTTSPLSLADSLERLLAPFKRLGIPAHEVGMTLSISLRFIPILIDEADCIQKSQTSRGADWSGNPLNRIRGLLSIFVPLLVSSLRQANDLALAMDSRCYRGGKGRTSFQSLKMGKGDWTAIAIVLGCAAICIGLDRQWP